MALLAQSALPKPLMHVHYYLDLKAHHKVLLLFYPGFVSSWRISTLQIGQNSFLAYDMCHLDGLQAAKNLLPWCVLWDRAGISVKK